MFLLSGHGFLRRGLSELLEHEGFEVVGEADSISAARGRVGDVGLDVALVENRLPDGTGIEACRALRSAAPSVRCLILSTYDEEKALRSVVLADAAGYILQKADGDALPEKLRRVVAGEQLHSPLAEQTERGVLAREPVPGLGRIEREILSSMLLGLTDMQIGTALDLPQETFATHLSSLLDKLGYRRAPDVGR